MRTPRGLSVLPNFCVHKVWRGHNRERNIKTDEDKAKYLEFFNLDVESEKYEQGSTLQALCLMSNHTHEISEVSAPKLFSNHMRRHHSRYGAYFNKMNNRCGKVAQDRPHTTLLETDYHERETVFYVHANPIRAGMVKDARNYHWSTHNLYAFGIRHPWMRNIKLPGWYLRLGPTPLLRQRAYRRLFAHYLKVRGRFKQSFLKKRFFGSIAWMKCHEGKISEWRRSLAPPSG